MTTIQDLMRHAAAARASDLHLAAGNPPILRIDGRIERTEAEVLDEAAVRGAIDALIDDEQRERLGRERDLDFAVAGPDGVRFRVNAYFTREGSAASFRLIPAAVPSLDDLGVPEAVARLTERRQGLVLVTGPTGSGKSTTLAALIDRINATRAAHIITIEDPVEYKHTPKRSLITHREVGSDARTFERALRAALREDPDVILVGEMRDHETIALALTAAETGHLVFGTLHTASAPKAVDRIVDVFPTSDKEMARAMLSTSLAAVVAQVLLTRSAGSGRVAAHEVLIGTPAVRNLIRENKTPQIASMIQMGQRFGMQSLSDALDRLVAQGLIDATSADEARRDLAQDEDRRQPSADNGHTF